LSGGVRRRDFIKMAAAFVASLSGATITSGARALERASQAEGVVLWGMAVDLTKCVKCGVCVTACQHKNNLPEGIFFNKIMTVKINGRDYTLPASCMHCRYPPCLYACPVAATYKRGDGIVDVDYSICIGCKYCAAACPYLARVPIEEDVSHPVHPFPKGVVAKCDFCRERIDAGLKPACVEACPFSARIFGNLKDPNSEIAHVLAAKRSVVVLRSELGTWPTWYYILG